MPANFRILNVSTWPRHAEMLNERHFLMAIMAAVAVHLVGFYVWYLMPGPSVVDIPVRALNIKLGMEDDTLPPEELKPAQPGKANYSAVEQTIIRLIREQEAEAARDDKMAKSLDKQIDKPEKPQAKPKAAPKPKDIGSLHKFDMRSEGVKSSAPVMQVVEHQFVRDLSLPAAKPAEKGSASGNSNAKEAETLARYEQLISLWIQKFKLYPQEAQEKGLQGETIVRIRIDRRGNIRYYTLESSTGHPLLDRAAVDMIRRANPVPAVPKNYPAGEAFEFRIPVTFQLQ